MLFGGNRLGKQFQKHFGEVDVVLHRVAGPETFGLPVLHIGSHGVGELRLAVAAGFGLAEGRRFVVLKGDLMGFPLFAKGGDSAENSGRIGRDGKGCQVVGGAGYESVAVVIFQQFERNRDRAVGQRVNGVIFPGHLGFIGTLDTQHAQTPIDFAPKIPFDFGKGEVGIFQILHKANAPRLSYLLNWRFPLVFCFVLARIRDNEQASRQCHHVQERKQSFPEGRYASLFYHIFKQWCKNRIFRECVGL